jgi:hypothetical protein
LFLILLLLRLLLLLLLLMSFSRRCDPPRYERFAWVGSRQNHKAVGILPEGPHWCYAFNCSSVELPPTTCKDTAKVRKSPLCLPCQARALSGCGHMQSCC